MFECGMVIGLVVSHAVLLLPPLLVLLPSLPFAPSDLVRESSQQSALNSYKLRVRLRSHKSQLLTRQLCRCSPAAATLQKSNGKKERTEERTLIATTVQLVRLTGTNLLLQY